MNQMELIRLMRNELDFHAAGYKNNHDAVTKQMIETGFKYRAGAYNSLLRSKFGFNTPTFSTKVQKYIEQQ